MKVKMVVEKEFDVRFVSVAVAVRYDEEDIPNDFPLRDGDMWRGIINVDSGEIQDWPQGKSGRLQMKVCDQGSYELLDESMFPIASIMDDYVPNGLIPGEYGDYIDLRIDETGKVTNWYAAPSVSDFMKSDD